MIIILKILIIIINNNNNTVHGNLQDDKAESGRTVPQERSLITENSGFHSTFRDFWDC